MMNKNQNIYLTIYQVLSNKSTKHARWWELNFPPTAADNLDVVSQIKMVNSKLRILFGVQTVDTVFARSCLVDTLQPKDWLLDIKQYVIPDMIRLVEIP